MPPSQTELTPMLFNMALTHLGSGASRSSSETYLSTIIEERFAPFVSEIDRLDVNLSFL